MKKFLVENDSSIMYNFIEKYKVNDQVKNHKDLSIFIPQNDAIISLLNSSLNPGEYELDKFLRLKKVHNILLNHFGHINDDYFNSLNNFSFNFDGNTIDNIPITNFLHIDNINVYIISGVLVDKSQINSQPHKNILFGKELTNCGYSDWSRIIEEPESCISLSRELKLKITEILATQRNLIYYYSHPGDAVKNVGRQEYNYLTPEFKSLSYEGKIEAIKNYGLREPGGINFREWPLQQWGKNIIRYSKLTNKHLLYVQADLWYCAYPLMFAEAMCSSLFSGHKHYPGSGFHFFGPNIDLFCVGSIEAQIRSNNFLHLFRHTLKFS